MGGVGGEGDGVGVGDGSVMKTVEFTITPRFALTGELKPTVKKKGMSPAPEFSKMGIVIFWDETPERKVRVPETAPYSFPFVAVPSIVAN